MISLLVGLGNVGVKYHHTRHNVGFKVLAQLVSDKILKPENCNEYDKAEIVVGGKNIIIAGPTQLMNNSGYAASALLHRYSLTPSEMLVIVDDFNLPLGALRIRKGGSDGGHNGLASIIEQLETNKFPRLRLGIGPLPEDESIVDFVLGEFEKEQKKIVQKMIKTASEAAVSVIENGVEEAMKKYNNNPA